MKKAFDDGFLRALTNSFDPQDIISALLGDAKGDSSLTAMGCGAISQWLVDGVKQTDVASTNLCLQSRNLASATWTVTAGTSGGTTAKTVVGTVKSADGTRDVNLYNAHDNVWIQSVSVPANAVGKEYVLSFLYTANADQLACSRYPDGGTTKRELCFKKNYWQRAVFRGTFASSGTVSIRWDFRKSNMTAAVKDTVAGFGFAIDDVQLEELTIGSRPTSYIPTTTTSASRGAGQDTQGQAFYVESANNGKTITARTATGDFSKKYSKEYYAIFLGQSNWFYGNAYNNYTHLVSPRVMAIGRRNGDASGEVFSGVQIPYKDPAQWNEALSATTGSPLAFGTDDMSSAGKIGDSLCDLLNLSKITLFTEDQGGTDFSTNDWTVTTGTLYTSMMARINAFLTANPTAECVGIFVSLQESDIFQEMTWSTFKTNYINMINGIRATVGNAPVVHIGVADDWISLGTLSSYPTKQALALSYMSEFRKMNDGTFGLSKSRFVDTAYAFNGGVDFASNGDAGIGSPLDYTHFNANTHYNIIPSKVISKYVEIM